MQKGRVSFALALPIVLACGGIGAAAGWMFPAHTLMAYGDRATKQNETKHLNSETTLPPTTQRIEPASPRLELGTPVEEITVVPQAELTQSVMPVPSPEVDTPEISSVRDTKKQRTRAEQRKRHTPRETEAPRRANPKEADDPRPRQKSVISQIPVLGPVFGLLVP